MSAERPSPATQAQPAAWALVCERSLDDLDAHLPALQAAGLLGAAEEGGRTRLYFPSAPTGLPVEGRWEPVPARDWTLAWRERLEPVWVGGLCVAAPWHATPDEATLVIEPGQAFGTGHHETTAGCLAALQQQRLAGRSVLDVGTGSGVLAIAAARLGAASVVACDSDPVACAIARDNAARNGVRVEVVDGGPEAVAGRRFDVVVANLDTATLTGEASRLAAAVARPGILIASGVSVERCDEAVRALRAAGAAVEDHPGREWTVLVGTVGAG